jgi:valyl-tRNA synthetase
MEKYGADGVRFGMLLSSPAGNDLLFDESLCEQGRNFSNKLWNAFRLVRGWEVDDNLPQPLHTATAIKWMHERLTEVFHGMQWHVQRYRISEALMIIYKLVWDDFCSCFLEVVKPGFQQPIDGKTYRDIIDIFEMLMQFLHPFMPFITEELWQTMRQRGEKESIMMTQMPVLDEEMDQKVLDDFAAARKVIEQVRRIRTEKNIAQKHALKLRVYAKPDTANPATDAVIAKLCNLDGVDYVAGEEVDGATFIENNIQYSVPLSGLVDASEEIKKLEADLKYAEGFLQGVMKKLSNASFVNNAPQKVVDMERKKQADAGEKIRIIKEQLAKLK